ncbi:MAG: hypothetical protein ACO1OB_22495, partial [Archangium sp.]
WKACSKKALDRYPTPLAMREALEAAAGGEIATTEELAKYLETLFPQSHQLRADRRHTIDAGIADFVRRQWADTERKETQPMMRAIEVPAHLIPPGVPAPRPPPPPAAPVAKPPPPPAPPKQPERGWTQPDEDDDKKDEGSSLPWVIVAALLVLGLVGFWAWKTMNAPLPIVEPTPPPVAEVIDAGAPVAEIVDAGEAAVVADADAGVADEDAGTAVAIAEPIDAGAAVTPTPAAPGEVQVSISSSPSLELLLEGQSLGKTPWSGKLPPGRKVFTLQNKALGINTTRVITVKTEEIDENYTFEKGFVSVKAPEGAGVFIDGNRVGTAPIRGEIPVYEGSHRIEVRVGQTKWGEPFTIYGSQRVSFNVELQ